MKKILVTGGLGYIGSHVVVELQNNGFEVLILDDLSNSSIDVLKGIQSITGIDPVFENIDLKSKNTVTNFFNRHSDIDGVIHFAASKAVEESVDNPLKYYDNNVGGLVYLLQELNKLKIQKFVFSSSCTVYGQAEKLPIKEISPFKSQNLPMEVQNKLGSKLLKTFVTPALHLKLLP